MKWEKIDNIELENQRIIVNKERDKLNKLEAKHFKTNVLPEMQKKVGKCFKRINSYGLGQNWWKYSKVIAVIGENQYRTMDFETCHGGRVNCDPRGYTLGQYLDKPITAAEFNRELNKEISKLKEFEA
jgi:hypothetical protein